MSLKAHLDELFGTSDLYAILDLQKTASHSEIRKAYRKLARQHHPDKAQHAAAEGATQRFQALSCVYAILTNTDQRAMYDRTGELEDAEALTDEAAGWAEYWRSLYEKLTPNKIEEFKTTYQRSVEEQEDIAAAYIRAEGDMNEVFDSVPCSDVLVDEDRFYECVRLMIASGEVPAFDKFTKEKPSKRKARRKRAQREREEFEELQAEDVPMEDMGSLEKAIQQRMSGRANLVDQLALRYGSAPEKGGKGRGKGKRGQPEEVEPSEEEFLATQQRLEKGKGKGKERRK